jgi:hypothetical protein
VFSLLVELGLFSILVKLGLCVPPPLQKILAISNVLGVPPRVFFQALDACREHRSDR